MPIPHESIEGLRNNNSHLTSLCLSNQSPKLTSDDIAVLVEALRTNQFLHCLDLSQNNIGDKGVEILSTLFHEGCCLVNLKIGYNHISDTGAKTLSTCHLDYLNLEGNQIGPEGASFLAMNTSLRLLNLNYNYIGDSGAAFLAVNSRLIALEIALNDISPIGATALATQNKNLLELNISSNDIKDSGAGCFAIHPNLVQLDISGNDISDESIKALSDNFILRELDVDSNNLTDASAVLLLKNKMLSKLDISNNNINLQGIKTLSLHPGLSDLTVSSNDITILAEDWLIFTNNPIITSLKITDRDLPDAIRQKLDLALERNKAISQEKNPIKRANSYGDVVGIYDVPSLMKLGLFAIKNSFSIIEIEKLKNFLPDEIYTQLTSD